MEAGGRRGVGGTVGTGECRKTASERMSEGGGSTGSRSRSRSSRSGSSSGSNSTSSSSRTSTGSRSTSPSPSSTSTNTSRRRRWRRPTCGPASRIQGPHARPEPWRRRRCQPRRRGCRGAAGRRRLRIAKAGGVLATSKRRPILSIYLHLISSVGQRRCLSHERVGNTLRQRRCLTHGGSGKTRQTRCLTRREGLKR